MPVEGAHDHLLVALSVLIATAASYTALDLAGRIRASTGTAAWAWLATAALAMGGGIWSMHFVAMLAFELPTPPGYDLSLTLASLAAPILVTGLAFAVVSRPRAGTGSLAASGLLMGLGIVVMHYVGMAAMRMPATVSYGRGWLAVSVLVAIGASVVALWLAFRRVGATHRVVAAAAMGAAVSGMHFAGMQAATFTAAAPVDGARGLASLGQTNLALAVAGTTFLILFLALVASLFDRRFALLAEREAQALRRSEERYRALYRNTPLPLHSLDQEGRITQVSDAWLALLGYTREEVAGRFLTDFMTPDSARRRLEVEWPHLVVTGEILEADHCFVTREGAKLDVLLSARVERDADGAFLRTLGGVIDVTARRRAEEALRQAQKMEAVGQLTGGLAHDFNNLLTVVLGNLEAASRATEAGNAVKAHRNIEAAAAGATRAAALTQRLLAFARRQPLQPQAVDVNRLVAGMAELLQRTTGAGVLMETVLAGGLWPTRIDPNQLENALLNLVINARDAMPEGGRLTIETANAHLDDAYAAAHDEIEPGQYVMVAVTDTGSGMPPEVIGRAFEPFFTTKEVGQGTGLGLSMIYGFVKQSGGHVKIYSEPGHGTTIKMYLPRVAAAEAAEEARPDAEEPREGAGETILLVEDEEAVRSYAAEILTGLGYRVIEAGDGQAALGLLDAHPEVELLFTDVGLPRLNGRDLALEAVRRRPGLPVLYMTAFARNAVVHNGVLEPGVDLLQKPFTPKAMALRVRAALGTAAPKS